MFITLRQLLPGRPCYRAVPSRKRFRSPTEVTPCLRFCEAWRLLALPEELRFRVFGALTGLPASTVCMGGKSRVKR